MTVTDAEVAVLPAASRATAVSVWGAAAGGVPRHAVGRRQVYLVAQQVAVQQELHQGHPDIVGGGGGDGAPCPTRYALLAGAVTLTVGAVVSQFCDGDAHRRRGCGVAGGVAGNCGQRVGAAGPWWCSTPL